MRFAENLLSGFMVIFLTYQPWICGADVPGLDPTMVASSGKSDLKILSLLEENYKKCETMIETLKPSPGAALKIVSFILMAFYKVDAGDSEYAKVLKETSKIDEEISNQTRLINKKLEADGIDEFHSLRSMRSMLISLNDFHDENLKCLTNAHCQPNVIGRITNESVDPSSTFRSEFTVFINKYLREDETVYGKKAAKNVFENLIDEINSKKDSSLKCRDLEWKELGLLHRLEEFITLIVAKSYTMIIASEMYFHRRAILNNPSDAYQWIISAIYTAKKFYQYIPQVYSGVEKVLSKTFTNTKLCPKDTYENGLVLVPADFAQKNWRQKYGPDFNELLDKYNTIESIVEKLYE